ncbi:hypothetical protein KAFR_0E04310 [Kazachstania africana CBS 2517]|uniref:Importin N-terminal domain-containing protein n=1 Tax=Kazachstania africana (strain ATCC 22294 / BCRC 22015 / CBS 2517 / CECT 1963 / NBRC 1671 / NRRL Y-8276) TaxID=1071382 RepID=H2AW32_KAZAF|nr:hypothetical protein KAFR_0E04310 [Kazachstania africana CBS 2517]CCF58582.1 hypothetical protein KAFR_0E04310 [Kazachstania africana CBS 2517]
MDANVLLHCFSGTLVHDASIRKNAESHLQEASKTPGFLGACLDIIASGEVNTSIKLSASLYFKNKITYGWDAGSNSVATKNELLNFVVDNDEKPVVKDMLLQTMLQCSKNSPQCVKILKSALTVIISSEYARGRWEELLPKSLELLSSDDIDFTHVGLICLSEIFRTYRWKDNDARQELEKLILEYFPQLLEYANNSLFQNGSTMTNNKVGELMKLILKIYKFVTYYDLPFTTQRAESFIPWANLFVSIIQHPIPADALNGLDVDQRKLLPWVKCKKWAYANLFRLFQRYGSTSLSKKFEYNEFKQLYVEQFLPQFLQLIFQQIEQWRNNSLWLSGTSLYYILSFLEQSITQKPTWELVGPHYDVMLKHIIFPLLKPTEETLELFKNDPQEYIHRNLEFWDNDYSSDSAAVSLLVTAVNKRGKSTLQPTLEFLIETSQANCADFENIQMSNALEIESSLKIFSNIIDRLTVKNSPYLTEIEGFLSIFVFPFFNSPFGFLKARACDICSKLGTVELKQPISIVTIYEGIMLCLNDSSDCLPINLAAALALQIFISDPHFRQTIAPSVIPIMQKLLALSNDFESDAISGVMQEFVEQFSEQLQPFGVELINTLVQQFLKLAIDLNEASNIDPNSLMTADDIPDETDKQMAALGILSTIISILLSFENSLDVVKSLEQSFYPAAEFILKNEMEDFYREVCEFVENSTFLLRQITPFTWKILELVGECNRKDNSMVSYYLEDFMLMINNILVYGNEELRKNEFYSKILLEIYQKSEITEDSDLDELNIIFDFSQKIILAMGAQLSPYFRELFLKDATRCILAESGELSKNCVFGVTSFNVVIASMISSVLPTLKFLQQTNCFQLFFETWITSYIPNYKRVFDIKLSIMGILNIIGQLNVGNFSDLSIDTILQKLTSDLIMLIKKYPIAEQELKLKRKEFSSLDFDSNAEWNDISEFNENDEEPEEDIEKYMELTKNKTTGLDFVDCTTFDGNNSFDDLEEDPLSKSLLDDIDIYSLFKSTVTLLQQNNAANFQVTFGTLTAEQQQTLSEIMNI